MYEAAIIGGGPAGLAATMYCVRKGMDVQLITATLGGKSTLGLTLPDMSEYHIIKAREQVRTFQGKIEYLPHTWRTGKVTGIAETEAGFTLSLSGHGQPSEVEAERIVIATGTTPSPLGVPGEADFFGQGLGSSAISYSHLLRNRAAVVIGDSDRAIEAAIECAEQCEEVSLVLEPHATYSHRHLEFAGARENVEIYNGYRAVRIEGDEFARRMIICRDDRSAGGCGPEKTLFGEAFFVERTPRPNSNLVAGLVERTPTGEIRINEKNETSHKRIFAAGDVTTVGIEQILVALGEGARAGLSAYRQHTMQV
ncbi:MAG: NAD(P)/FAD-dependent oxidoreductase [Spirochaeta sp.]|jgi:alkyl hydroperoxide reductase subunit F|nr:NAD(P)/FAD-dependent oxidoreductase [Spirochaeta sp.]